MADLEDNLSLVLKSYSQKFDSIVYEDNYNDTDLLMDAFNITQELKRENKQYWGRELGKCWEILLRNLFKYTCKDYSPPKKFNADEPADFFVGNDAIDTKYRVGSGDAGTLKKFEAYGKLLKREGYRPIFLFLRTDNLQAALSKMEAGGWTNLIGEDAFSYILDKTKFDLKKWLIDTKNSKAFFIER